MSRPWKTANNDAVRPLEKTRRIGAIGGLTPIPAPAPAKGDFPMIRQGNVTNALTKVRPTGQNTSVNQITGAATLVQGNLTLTAQSIQSLQAWKTSTLRLLDFLSVILTKSGAKTPAVLTTLEEYMNKCKLKDRKQARAQVVEDLETIFNARLSYQEPEGASNKRHTYGNEGGFTDVRICDKMGVSRSGDITFSFGYDFFNMLRAYPVMYYPPQLWTLNPKRNPNSYFLLRRISEHKNMNVGKHNEDTISVATLVQSAPFLPSYEEVSKGDRALTRRIITPFERDMDALDETLTWEYCHANGVPLTDEELESMDYTIFIRLNVHTQWRAYPSQTARLAAKAERIRQAQAKRQSRVKRDAK